MEKMKIVNNHTFFDKYMSNLKPVIITNIFEGEAIRNVNTKEKALELWGDTLIGIQPEYAQSYQNKAGEVEPGNKKGDQTMSLSDYFNYVKSNPDTKMMSIEFPSPKDFKASYEIPSICDAQRDESTDFVNQCFIGNKGNFAHIHFDKAGTHGFLYQVFGKKKFIVFPKESARKLAPFTQVSAWNLENFSRKDYQDFIRFTKAQEVILNPGDCMYVPAMSWHYADYIEDSMSISLRFRRPNFITKLVNILFPDICLQYIAQTIGNQNNADNEYSWVLKELEDEWNKTHNNGLEKVSATRERAKIIYNKLSPSKPRQGDYSMDIEQYFPPLLPHLLDANDPQRKFYK